MLKTVDWYIRHGYPVMPLHWIESGRCSCGMEHCSSPGKHPLTREGLKDASLDSQRILEWWTRWPSANIAYVVPQDRCLLDVDGPEVLQAMKYLDVEVPPTGTVKTGNGWQYHYLVPPGIVLKPGTNILPNAKVGTKGVDLRAAGSYGILPPSIHYTGRIYTWETPPTDNCEAPDWVLEVGQRNGNKPSDWSPSDIDGMISDMSEGQRNETLYKIGCSRWSKGLKEGEVRSILFSLNQQAAPPLPDSEVEGIVQSVISKPPGRSPEFSTTGATQEAPAESIAERAVKFMKIDDLMETSPDPILFVIPEIAPEGLILLVGPPKTGKSWLAYAIAMAVAEEKRVLGRYDLPMAHKVLYVDMEQSERRSYFRIQQLKSKYGFRATNVLLAWDFPALTEGCEEQLCQVLDDNPDLKVIILDTFSKLHPETGAPRGLGAYHWEYKLLDGLHTVAKERGVSIILIHHDNKTDPDDPLDKVSGTKAMTGVPDTIWILRRKKRTGDQGTLLVTGRDVREAQHNLLFEDGGTWRFDDERDQVPT